MEKEDEKCSTENELQLCCSNSAVFSKTSVRDEETDDKRNTETQELQSAKGGGREGGYSKQVLQARKENKRKEGKQGHKTIIFCFV